MLQMMLYGRTVTLVEGASATAQALPQLWFVLIPRAASNPLRTAPSSVAGYGPCT